MLGCSIRARACRSDSKRARTLRESMPALDQLECHLAADRAELLGEEDRAHAALADLLAELVAIGDYRIDEVWAVVAGPGGCGGVEGHSRDDGMVGNAADPDGPVTADPAVVAVPSGAASGPARGTGASEAPVASRSGETSRKRPASSRARSSASTFSRSSGLPPQRRSR